MIIKINMKSEIPIYLQLRNQIVMGIGKGEFEEGELLPTVRQMAAVLGINNMTVSKAYQLLKSEGFICIPGYEGGDRQEEFQEKLEEELELLSAEAKIRGMSYKDFLEYCRQAFGRMEVAAE